MRVVNLSTFDNSLVLHFETDGNRINAYTLASTLVWLADAAKAANAAVNPGYDVEIVVEAIGPGSFRAKLTAVYSKARNIFSDQRLQAVILSILASFIYERTLSVNHELKVEIHTNEVIVESGQDRLIVPREVHNATRLAEKNPQFIKAVEKTLESISCDDHVSSFGFAADIKAPTPEVLIPKWVMEQAAIIVEEDPSDRVISEQCSLQIVKAILERSRRKWEFVWRGIRISAPIVDDKFYSDFGDHRITIAPGDELKVRLLIKQSRDPKTGIYTNLAYEVAEVFEHVPGIRQETLDNQISSS